MVSPVPSLPVQYRSFPHLNSVPSSSSTAGRFLFSFFSVAFFFRRSALVVPTFCLLGIEPAPWLEEAGSGRSGESRRRSSEGSRVDALPLSRRPIQVLFACYCCSKGCLKPHILETRHKQGEHIETSPLLRVAIAPIKLLGRFHREHGRCTPLLACLALIAFL